MEKCFVLFQAAVGKAAQRFAFSITAPASTALTAFLFYLCFSPTDSAQDPKISEGMKRRYAEINKTTKASEGSHATSQVGKAGGRLTAAGRKKLSDLMKKRWAERRKGKAK